MNSAEAAVSLGVTTSTVTNQVNKGRLKATKRNGHWELSASEVERYRQEVLGHHGWKLNPELRLKQIASVRSPEARAKMREAKVGRPQTPQHIERAAASRRGRPLSEAHRERIAAAQRGKTLAPDHLEALRAAHLTPQFHERMSKAQTGQPRSPEMRAKLSAAMRGRRLTPEHRAAISRGQVAAYLAGRKRYSDLDIRAAALLLPLGYVRFPWMDGHAFDFGSADGSVVIEVNGCRFHNHRDVNPACPFSPRHKTDDDTRWRAIAAAHDLRLVELWQCEEADWVSKL